MGIFFKKKKKDKTKTHFPTNAEKIQPTHHISFFFFFLKKTKQKTHTFQSNLKPAKAIMAFCLKFFLKKIIFSFPLSFSLPYLKLCESNDSSKNFF